MIHITWGAPRPPRARTGSKGRGYVWKATRVSGLRHGAGTSQPEIGSPPTGLANDAAGIADAKPHKSAVQEGEWANIGAIVLNLDGTVRMLARPDLSAAQRVRLRAMADQVWIRGFSALPDWRFDTKYGWIAGIRMR